MWSLFGSAKKNLVLVYYSKKVLHGSLWVQCIKLGPGVGPFSFFRVGVLF